MKNNLFLSLLMLLSSCVHSQVARIEPIIELPQEWVESSGLIYYDSCFWTHNDSGGEAEIVALSPKGDVKHCVILENAENIDWEDITQDEHYIYISDTGNNHGLRLNFTIYRIAKKDLISDNKTIRVFADAMRFSYPEYQKRAKPYQHDFDCEAITSVGDEIYLFTKSWKTGFARVYSLQKTTTPQSAQFHQIIDRKGLITGADFNAATGKIVLCGYDNKGSNSSFFVEYLLNQNGLTQTKYYLLGNQPLQIEALCWVDSSIYISHEGSNAKKKKAFQPAEIMKVHFPN